MHKSSTYLIGLRPCLIKITIYRVAWEALTFCFRAFHGQCNLLLTYKLGKT